MSGESDINYYLGTTPYPHHYTISQDTDGNLSGSGYYIPNNGYTELIIGGNVVGNVMTMSIDYTGLNPSYALTVVGNIQSDGSAEGYADSNTGQHFTWSWPAESVEKIIPAITRSAAITNPVANESVWGNVDFTAYLIDDDNLDGVQWAIRPGVCTSGAPNVWGNVDGSNDTFDWTWDGGTYTRSFLFTADTSTLKEGLYCFVFNPRESTGDTPIRLEREFRVEKPDSDHDGVLDGIDYCPETNVDSGFTVQAANRWTWSGLTWQYVSPKTKALTNSSKVTMNYTFGCSCKDILDDLKAANLGQMVGQYKYGCSSSIIDDFHTDLLDGKLDGKYLVDTVTVDSSKVAGASSIEVLNSGTNYTFEVSGVWQNRGWEKVDAKYTSGDNWGTYLDAPAGGYLPALLDLQIGNNFVDWGAYSASHSYSSDFVGNGSTVNFRVFDGDVNSNTPDLGWYGDNIGSLTVKIYGQI